MRKGKIIQKNPKENKDFESPKPNALILSFSSNIKEGFIKRKREMIVRNILILKKNRFENENILF